MAETRQVNLALADGVAITLTVNEGVTVKKVKLALAALGACAKTGSGVELEDAGTTLSDDASLPAAGAALRFVKEKAATGAPKVKKASVPAAIAKPKEEEKKPKEVRTRKVPAEKRASAAATAATADGEAPTPKKEKVRAAPKEKMARQSTLVKKKPQEEACPELEEARHKVAKLSAKSIQQMIGATSPPEMLVSLLEHVVLAVGLTVKSWESLAKELSDIQFVKKMCQAEPNFTDRNMRKLDTYVVPDLPEVVKSAGETAAAFAEWLQQMVKAARRRKAADGVESARASHHALPLVKDDHDQSASPTAAVDVAEELQALELAAADVQKVKTSDFRDLRSLISSSPSAAKALAAVQAALGMKDTSPEAAQRLILNPKAFNQTLTAATQNPKDELALSRAEYLALGRSLKDPLLSAANLDKEKNHAVATVLQWARCVHAYAHKFQRTPEKNHAGAEKKGDEAGVHADPAVSPPTPPPAAAAAASPPKEAAVPAPVVASPPAPAPVEAAQAVGNGVEAAAAAADEAPVPSLLPEIEAPAAEAAAAPAPEAAATEEVPAVTPAPEEAAAPAPEAAAAQFEDTY